VNIANVGMTTPAVIAPPNVGTMTLLTRKKDSMKLTNQEMFDKAYVGIVKQGRPAYTICPETGDVHCVYLASDGDMCAFGHIMDGIVDKDSPRWNSKQGVYGSDLGSLFDGVPEHGSPHYLASCIQTAHDKPADAYASNKDGAVFIEAYKKEMATIAKSYNLVVPTIAPD
jgi:hypothetical protein